LDLVTEEKFLRLLQRLVLKYFRVRGVLFRSESPIGIFDYRAKKLIAPKYKRSIYTEKVVATGGLEPPTPAL
tara:strand:- start:2 stop:217 length:216 start_codon:yes stop_codon:yes gene_type:complete